MELDKRINDIGAILTCFSIKAAKEYLGQQGYFTSDIDHYQDLDLTDFRTLTEVCDDDTPFCAGQVCYQFFLPAEFVRPAEKKKPAEKKWRPFTLDEFLAKFPLGSPVTFRRKIDGRICTKCFTGYEPAEGNVFFGIVYSLVEMFRDYELKDKDGNWTPFGVEE